MPKGVYERTKYHREKISIGSKEGKTGNHRKGQEWSQEVKERISKTLQRPRPEFRGHLHPRWVKGNINYWKKQAKIRDDFTCQVCGLYDSEIVEVDHIKPKASYPVLYKELSNMQTICPNCHRRKTLRGKEFTKQVMVKVKET